MNEIWETIQGDQDKVVVEFEHPAQITNRIEYFKEEIDENVNLYIKSLVLNLHTLRSFGYPFTYTMTSKHDPDTTYSIVNVKESGNYLYETLKKTNDQALIDSALRLKEKDTRDVWFI